MPDVLSICKPIIDNYGIDSNREMAALSNSHNSEDKNQLFSFESSELSEIDGMFVRTALVYYCLKLLIEIFRRGKLIFCLLNSWF